MLRLCSFDVDTPKCQNLFRFVGTHGGVQLFSRTSATRSSKMLFRPTWAVLCSCSVIEIVPYCLDSDLFGACLFSTLDILFLRMAVGSFDSCGPSAFVRRSCSNV